jgi:hypothetical protein
MKITTLALVVCSTILLTSCSHKVQDEADFKKEFGVSVFPHDNTELEAVKPIIQNRLLGSGNAISDFVQEMQTAREQAMSISADTAEGLEKRIVALRKCDNMESHYQELIHTCEYLCDLSCSAGLEAHYEPRYVPGHIYYGGYGGGGF